MARSIAFSTELNSTQHWKRDTIEHCMNKYNRQTPVQTDTGNSGRSMWMTNPFDNTPPQPPRSIVSFPIQLLSMPSFLFHFSLTFHFLLLFFSFLFYTFILFLVLCVAFFDIDAKIATHDFLFAIVSSTLYYTFFFFFYIMYLVYNRMKKIQKFILKYIFIQNF